MLKIILLVVVSFVLGFFINGHITWSYIFDLTKKDFIIHTWKNKKYKITEWDESMFDKNVKNKQVR